MRAAERYQRDNKIYSFVVAAYIIVAMLPRQVAEYFIRNPAFVYISALVERLCGNNSGVYLRKR